MSSAPTTTEIIRGPGSLVVVVFPPAWLALEVDDTDNDPRTAERPETARRVWQRLSDAVALIDGPMFQVADGRPYETSEQSRLLYRYLDRRRNVDVPTRYPERGATLSVDAEGRASMMRGAAELPGATFAVQGYPEILRRGENVGSTEHDTNATMRAALVLLSDGRVGFAISRSGIRALGELLGGASASGGATVTDAVYTDGGGSMALALRGANGSDLVAENMGGRRLPVFVLAIPPRSGPGARGSSWWGTVAALGSTAAAVALVRYLRGLTRRSA